MGLASVARCFVLFALGMAALGGCGSATAPPKPVASTKPLDGYGKIKLGISFREAMEGLDAGDFNPYSLRQCLDDLPLDGCFLSASENASAYEVQDGIPYVLALSFNRHDKLTDINLSYSREKKVTQAECLTLHERTLDWLTKAYGEFRFSTHHNQKDPARQVRSTPDKHQYAVALTQKDFFVTAPMRSLGNLPAEVTDRVITEWGRDRYVSLFTTFIIVDGKPACSVDIGISEPASIERRKP